MQGKAGASTRGVSGPLWSDRAEALPVQTHTRAHPCSPHRHAVHTRTHVHTPQARCAHTALFQCALLSGQASGFGTQAAHVS